MSDEKKEVLVSNKAQCNQCKTIIESTHRHDFKYCTCGAIFVDGGLAYIRRGGQIEDINEMSEYE